MALKLTVGTVTDRGLNPKRTANEDRLLALPDARLFLVADGVGGRRGGQVASQTVMDVFKNAFEDGHRAGNDLLAALKQTIGICNRSIFDSSSEIAELRGMATTVALVAAINDTRAIIGHVGDSRVYRFDGKALTCETQDHSEVNDAIRAGLLTPAQAAHHPRRNVINRAVGAEQEVEADFKVVQLTEKTTFLLCSDGITRHLNDAELTDLLRSGGHPQKLCDRLKEICFERGAEDNLSAVIVDFGERSYKDLAERTPSVKTQAAGSNGQFESSSKGGRGRFEVEVPVAESYAGADSRPMTGRLTMLEMPEPEPRAATAKSESKSESRSGPSMFMGDRKANAPSKKENQEAERAETNFENKAGMASSDITFWGNNKSDKGGSSNATNNFGDSGSSAKGQGKSKGSAAREGAYTWQVYLVIFFYLALLAAAFGFGRYYDQVVAWVYGEPVATSGRTLAGAAASNDADLQAARALFQAGRFDAARAQFEELARKSPANGQYQYWLGASLFELGKHSEALKPLQEAARLEPKMAEIHLRLAMTHAALKDQRNADDELRKAANLLQ